VGCVNVSDVAGGFVILKKKLLFIVNVDWFFLSHRLPIAIEAQNQGYEVHIAVSVTDKLESLESHGFIVHPLTLDRSSTGLMGGVKTFIEIFQILRDIRPHIVHLVTIKPVLLGGIATRLSGVPAMVAAIPGLGTLFISNNSRISVLRYFVQKLYSFALGHSNSVIIVQNSDDKSILLDMQAIKSEQVRLIRGSGVDLKDYSIELEPAGTAVITMAARLLRDKGVYEFVEAARLINAGGIDAEFRLIGDIDPGNPTTITEAELQQWRQEGCVKILGFRDDIARQYAQSNIVCLPSYYREGLPKCLVEAAACGRAVVTTDMPGCRDAIEPDKTGLLVPPRDAAALADAIQRLIENPELRYKMGEEGRKLAEQEFAIEKIVNEHLIIYKELEMAV